LGIGVDRLDYTKGIPERLRAVELMLRRHPDLRQKFAFVQISAVSRAEVNKYELLSKQVGILVSVIGDAFSAKAPIVWHQLEVERSMVAGLCRHADVAMITPLADGMNLVAKEFVAAQLADDPGVLMLSKYAGAAVELQGGQEKVRFQLGPNGITRETGTDGITIVAKIEDESQAQRKGVKPGWKFHKLGSAPFSDQKLDALIAGSSDYDVTFLKDRGAIIVDPYNTHEMAELLHQALTMGAEERKARWECMNKNVSTVTGETWGMEFISKLHDVQIGDWSIFGASDDRDEEEEKADDHDEDDDDDNDASRRMTSDGFVDMIRDADLITDTIPEETYG